MPTMNVTVAHQLPEEEATDRLRGLLETMSQEHSTMFRDLEVTWGDHGARFQGAAGGASASGSLRVETGEVRITVELPFLAGTFQNQIEEYIRETVERELSD
ncbi:MAG: polyhydroxyalkanoic acid system family protein [Planctomycetota bacterium]